MRKLNQRPSNFGEVSNSTKEIFDRLIDKYLLPEKFALLSTNDNKAKTIRMVKTHEFLRSMTDITICFAVNEEKLNKHQFKEVLVENFFLLLSAEKKVKDLKTIINQLD